MFKVFLTPNAHSGIAVAAAAASVSVTGPSSGAKLEVERKFLVKSEPVIPDDLLHKQITQAYLEITADKEIRIRRSQQGENVEYTKTTKYSGSDTARPEEEIPITQGLFDSLFPSHIGNVIQKNRYPIPGPNGLVFEYDVYQGDLAPLTVVEVEFPNQEACDAFNPPDWFGEDVSKNKALKNQKLALNGVPADILGSLPVFDSSAGSTFAARKALENP
jgi:CYTH domain-containing protein